MGREEEWRGGEGKGDLVPVGPQDTSSNILLCTAVRGYNARRHSACTGATDNHLLQPVCVCCPAYKVGCAYRSGQALNV